MVRGFTTRISAEPLNTASTPESYGALPWTDWFGVARNFSVVAAAQAITWTATFLFTLAQARYLGPARFGELSLALSYAVILGVVVDFGLSTKLAGREAFLYPSLGSIAQRGSAAVLGVAALAAGLGIVVVAAVYIAASVLQVLVLLAGMRRHPVASTTLERAAVVDMFRGTATLGCFWILGAFYYNVDMVVLQRLVPPENVAWYAAASRLFHAGTMFVGFSLGSVLYPLLSA